MIPADREPDEVFRSIIDTVTLTDPEDSTHVAELLGRPPQGEFRVVARHRDGSPVVIENAPLLDDGTPMPTRYWLVGEPERTWVGRLESQAGVVRAEGAVDPGRLADAHARYAAMRDAELPVDHIGPRPSGGVGGTRRGVKCLHAHYAWWIVGGDDPVGEWVAARLRDQGHVSEATPSRAPDDGTRPTSGDARTAKPVAAIDCGTNSTRLLIAASGPSGSLVSIERTMHITRLGARVDATGRLDPEAIGRTLDVLGEYRRSIDVHGVGAIRATATSAARDASNREDFFAPAAEILGVRPELLSGSDEAGLSFAGATAELKDRPGRYLVCDIGGGSTEFAVGSIDADGVATVSGAESVNIGCVRITERFLSGDPPSASELAVARNHCDTIVADVLDRVLRGSDATELVGLAGTVSTLASIDQGLGTYDRDRIHHHVLSAARITELSERLLAISSRDRMQVPGMEAGRAEVIAGGLVVLRSVLAQSGQERLIVSESDILDGLAASLLA